ncbi:MAG: Hsp70 family protein [Rubrobacter sp.]|nr:Hsp70 family protein [Rubrobacter sp.]
MSEQVPSIGIDFGTTNSSMAWYDSRTGSAEIILNAEGQTRTPSLVYFGENETLVGELVESLIKEASTDKVRRDEVFRRVIKSIKRNLLTPPRIALPGGRFVRPADVVAEILKKLKRDAEDGHFHEEVGQAIITYPAEFNRLQRQRIEEAGRLAGFGEVILLEEPVAGTLAYARSGLNVGKHVLVYDLGGGKFDLAVLDNEDESFHVAMEPNGMERYGGDDFDHALYYYCDELAREKLGRSISLTGAVDLSFLRECRRRKESLTFQERIEFNDYLPSEDGPVLFEHEVERQTFEDLIEEYVETSARLTEEILKQAAVRGHEVDTVVLVGGSTRVPLVMRTLEETLPVSPLVFDRKDIVVALGAAHYTNVRSPTIRRGRQPEASVLTPEDQTPLNQYREAVEEAFSDKKLSKVEVDRLSAFAGQLGLNKEQTADIERQVMGGPKEGVLLQQYRQVVEMVWADGKLNELEVEWLSVLTSELGLSQDQTSYAESEIMGATKESILDRQGPSTGPQGELEDFVVVHTFAGHSEEVHSVAFSPDGQFLVSGASDHTVRGWNTRSGQSVGALAGHTGRVSSVAFSPDGELLASGGFDKIIRVWKLPNGEPFHNLNHSGWVFSVAFSPDGKLLTSGAADKAVRVWSVETGRLIRTLAGHSYWVLSVAIGSDGQFLVSGGADKTVKVWNLETDVPLYTFEHSDWIRSVAIDPDDRFIAGGGEDGAIKVWDLETGELVRTLAGHSGATLSIAISPDGQLLVSSGSEGKIKVWNPRTGEPLHIFPGHLEGVGSIAFSPDGQLLASGGYDHEIKIWRRVPGLTEEKPVSLSSRSVNPPSPHGLDVAPSRPQDLPD